jgi:CRISPR-associated protein (TIGR03986 family)
MSLAKHTKKVSKQRKAVAPYNFVEIPDKPISVDATQNLNFYNEYTGRIDCHLTTESPIYIRCGLNPGDYAQIGDKTNDQLTPEERRIKSRFFCNAASNKATIPGSSLRGMLRTLIEIISFSKIDRVSDEVHLFFRAVAANPKYDSLGRAYKRLLRKDSVKAGFLVSRFEGGSLQWYVCPSKAIGKDSLPYVLIDDKEVCSEFPREFVSLKNQNYCPQYLPREGEYLGFGGIFAKNGRHFARSISKNASQSEYKGVLITSGNMADTTEVASKTNRRYHCLVRERDNAAKPIKISGSAIEDYCSSLTDFQKQAPFDQEKGILKNGRCIFYCQPQQAGEIQFFGQSPNFRVPYRYPDSLEAASAFDFVPENLKDSQITDIAESIFGFVKSSKQERSNLQSLSSRISITDGVCCQTGNNIWFSESEITPQILASPKPTTFQHYLSQPTDQQSELQHYANKPKDETVIRGHKLYWHKGKTPNIKIDSSKTDIPETQKTRIKPIKPGVNFRFSIHFENLSSIELGALFWVLKIAQDDRYRLSLGMGKPLGMGAIKIEHRVYLSDRVERYNQLFSNGNDTQWHVAETIANDQREGWIRDFEQYVLDNISNLDHPKQGKAICLKELPRIKMLLAMLSWKEHLTQDELNERRYMEIERDRNENHVIGRPAKQSDSTVNEYKERPVLPTPLQIMDIEDDRQMPAPPTNRSQESSKRRNARNKRPQNRNKGPNKRDKGNGGSSAALQRGPRPPKK